MRILFLQKRLLFPTMTGGQIRTLNVLRHLARRHEVTYLCNVQDHETQYLPQMRELGLEMETIPWRETPRRSLRFFGELALNLMSQFPFNVNKDYDPRLRRRAEQLLRERDYDLLVCDFVQMARNAIGLPAPASLLFQHNVEAQIFERHAKQDRGRLRRRFMALQWRKMRRFEADAGRSFDGVIAVSEADRNRFETEYGWDHVREIDTAVDTDYFQPAVNPERAARIVFVGSLDWLPNEDGVRYFVEQVWPLVRRRHPEAEFQAVGRNPSDRLRRLAEAPGVEIVGTVPDVRPYLAEAGVVVVPLLVGGGTRLKIFEAMAMRKAVVSTSLGAEGLHVDDGDNILLADSPTKFADSISRLINDPDLRNEIAGRARRLVVDNYSAEAVASQFDTICREVVARSSPAHTGDSVSTLVPSGPAQEI